MTYDESVQIKKREYKEQEETDNSIMVDLYSKLKELENVNLKNRKVVVKLIDYKIYVFISVFPYSSWNETRIASIHRKDNKFYYLNKALDRVTYTNPETVQDIEKELVDIIARY